MAAAPLLNSPINPQSQQTSYTTGKSKSPCSSRSHRFHCQHRPDHFSITDAPIHHSGAASAVPRPPQCHCLFNLPPPPRHRAHAHLRNLISTASPPFTCAIVCRAAAALCPLLRTPSCALPCSHSQPAFLSSAVPHCRKDLLQSPAEAPSLQALTTRRASYFLRRHPSLHLSL
jgi:hypothetical protein